MSNIDSLPCPRFSEQDFESSERGTFGLSYFEKKAHPISLSESWAAGSTGKLQWQTIIWTVWEHLTSAKPA